MFNKRCCLDVGKVSAEIIEVDRTFASMLSIMVAQMFCKSVQREISSFALQTRTVVIYQMRSQDRNQAVVAQRILNTFFGDMYALYLSPFATFFDFKIIESTTFPFTVIQFDLLFSCVCHKAVHPYLSCSPFI